MCACILTDSFTLCSVLPIYTLPTEPSGGGDVGPIVGGVIVAVIAIVGIVVGIIVAVIFVR